MQSQIYETEFADKTYVRSGVPLCTITETSDCKTQPSTTYVVARRVLDISLTLAILTILFPVFLVLAIIVKRDSKGPILFKQYRVGENGRLFWFYKFRSMIADAEACRIAMESMNEASWPLFKVKNDPRITRCGRWMRKYSLDELPQLLNVLKGEMSLVGPRPALPAEVDQYSEFQRGRLSTKPGITGLWQVSGRSDLSFEQSVKIDLDYIYNQSLWLDFTILLRTFGAVVKGRGAY